MEGIILLSDSQKPCISEVCVLCAHTQSLLKKKEHCKQAAPYFLDKNNCISAHFRQAGAVCTSDFYDFPCHPQATASGTHVLQAHRSQCSLGTRAAGQGASHSSQVCLCGIAPASYARILSAVLAFYFSNCCYFTFKVGCH